MNNEKREEIANKLNKISLGLSDVAANIIADSNIPALRKNLKNLLLELNDLIVHFGSQSSHFENSGKGFSEIQSSGFSHSVHIVSQLETVLLKNITSAIS